MAKHPCAGMSVLSVEAFDEIAAGNPLPAVGKRTIEKMLAKGLIEESSPKILRDKLGSYSIPQYYVPVHHHIQWCEWCSAEIRRLAPMPTDTGSVT